MAHILKYDPGSYRDREGRIFYDDAWNVFRALSKRALAEWDALRQTRFFPQAVDAGYVVRSRQLDSAEADRLQNSDGWAGLLSHEIVPFVSYPFEWSFGMLQDAALLHLDLLDSALDEDFTLKDGTAYNVQWRGVRPVFIDVASFEKNAAGQPWAGYRQFCQTFLFPLLLQAYKNVPFQPWLRGRLDGISPQDCWSLMSFRDLFRRGVPSHVFLHAWLQSHRGRDKVHAAEVLPQAGFGKELIRQNLKRLLQLVGGLRWSPAASEWSDYANTNSYSAGDQQRKENFVRTAVRFRHWGRAWDVGCNTGTYSRIAAENSDHVIAMDADHLAIERLYQGLRAAPAGNGAPILPLVNNLADQCAGLGWRGVERKGLTGRGRPDLTLCLALVHHLVIGHGIPLRELLTWFADLRTSLVIEFVTKEDPMVRRLLRGRRDNYADYEPQSFETLLSAMFEVVRTEPLESGTRTLYFAVPRSS